MKQKLNSKDKDLLLRDLSARVPFGVMCEVSNIVNHPVKLAATYINGDVVFGVFKIEVEKVKPYLFPLTSMTKDQIEEYHSYCYIIFDQKIIYLDSIKSINWLIEHHFDVNDLISRNLAIDATSRNIY